MEKMHINDRGTHTTVIEKGQVMLDVFAKRKDNNVSIRVSPGKIEAGVKARSTSVKFKHINDELYEMVVTHNSSRQEFKVFTRASYQQLEEILKQDKRTRDWNSNYTDMRGVNRVSAQQQIPLTKNIVLLNKLRNHRTNGTLRL